MELAQEPTPIVSSMEVSCADYRDLFTDLWRCGPLKRLHLGMIGDIARHLFPRIAKRLGTDPQALHSLIATPDWGLEGFCATRLEHNCIALGKQPFVHLIDTRENDKKGTATDYLACHSRGTLGPGAEESVSVSAIGVHTTISFPLPFAISKPSETRKDHTSSLCKSLVSYKTELKRSFIPLQPLTQPFLLLGWETRSVVCRLKKVAIGNAPFIHLREDLWFLQSPC